MAHDLKHRPVWGAEMIPTYLVCCHLPVKHSPCSSFLLAQKIVDRLHKRIEFTAVNIVGGAIDLESAAVRR